MRIGLENPMTLDSASERGALEHPLIFRRDHEISGDVTRSRRNRCLPTFERKRLLRQESASELVCHLQFDNGNVAEVSVWPPPSHDDAGAKNAALVCGLILTMWCQSVSPIPRTSRGSIVRYPQQR